MQQFTLLFLLFLQIGMLGYAEPWGVFYGLLNDTASVGVDGATLLSLWGINTMLPGGFMLNYASFFGYNMVGFWGAIVALCTIALPAFAFAGIATALRNKPHWQVAIEDAGYFLQLTAWGLFLAGLWGFGKTLSQLVTIHNAWHFGVMTFLIVATFLGTVVFRLRAWLMLLLCGLAGMLLF